MQDAGTERVSFQILIATLVQRSYAKGMLEAMGVEDPWTEDAGANAAGAAVMAAYDKLAQRAASPAYESEEAAEDGCNLFQVLKEVAAGRDPADALGPILALINYAKQDGYQDAMIGIKMMAKEALGE